MAGTASTRCRAQLSEEERMVCDIAAQFATDKLAPRVLGGVLSRAHGSSPA